MHNANPHDLVDTIQFHNKNVHIPKAYLEPKLIKHILDKPIFEPKPPKPIERAKPIEQAIEQEQPLPPAPEPVPEPSPQIAETEELIY